jgi:hypothetical protein
MYYPYNLLHRSLTANKLNNDKITLGMKYIFDPLLFYTLTKIKWLRKVK